MRKSTTRAAQAYINKHAETCRRMTLLMQAVQEHQVKFTTGGSINWGYCGDLDSVNNTLAHALHTMNVPEFQEH